MQFQSITCSVINTFQSVLFACQQLHLYRWLEKKTVTHENYTFHAIGWYWITQIVINKQTKLLFSAWLFIATHRSNPVLNTIRIVLANEHANIHLTRRSRATFIVIQSTCRYLNNIRGYISRLCFLKWIYRGTMRKKPCLLLA